MSERVRRDRRVAAPVGAPAGASTEPSIPRRRWDDLQPELAVTALARHLISEPSLDDVAEFLFALLCVPIGAEEVFITGPNPSGTVVLLGRYPAGAASPTDPDPVWAPTDVVAAVAAATLREAPTILTRPAAPKAGVLVERPIAAWPLGCLRTPTAFLVVVLSAPADPGQVTSRLHGLPEVLSLYVMRLAAEQDGDTERLLARHAIATAGHSDDEDTHPLSQRQRRVLELMARGLTNAQIALRVGFSESTVRVDSIDIYRHLGVHDRHQAVEVAAAIGLLGPPDPSCASSGTCQGQECREPTGETQVAD